jgi:cytochrome oxidase Cu insertion factor (SCO1/SenC/PrrC family)
MSFDLKVPGTWLYRRRLATAALCLAVGLGACAPITATPSVGSARRASEPRVSLFDHPWTWTDELGKPVTFSRWQGQPLVLTAIFTQCKATCPRTVAKLWQVYASNKSVATRSSCW